MSKEEIKIGLLRNLDMKTEMFRITKSYNLIVFNNPKSGAVSVDQNLTFFSAEYMYKG